MTLRPEYTLHQSEFGAFLYAPIWENRDEASLSVLSMLARLDLDPWSEAARLAALPREAAVSSLTAMLSRMPRNTRGSPDDALIADRLIDLLPSGASAAPVSGEGAGRRDATGDARRWLAIVLLAMLAGLMVNAAWT